MIPPTILVVDDKKNMLSLMRKLLKGEATVLVAENGSDALRILASQPVSAVLCDLKMPDMDGLEVLRASKKLKPSAQFVLMTAYATVGTAVEALKLGAYDYVTKPFDPTEVKQLVLRAVAVARPEPEATSDQTPSNLPGIIARSAEMQTLAQFVRKLADSDITTLVLGETGTGKEKIARAIHELGPRQNRRFIAVNCAAIPKELLESELFGHARGSFSGAVSNRKGLFEEAHGGSLFLDEIGDLLPSLQAKLTRVLEERVVRRVGETQERPIDVRLIAATHRDLEQMVKAGTFREDLWYRLNVALVRLPPLRERRTDIELLALHFLGDVAERTGKTSPRNFAPEALALLRQFDWPGNVRQLRSAVERAHVIASGEVIRAADLPPELSPIQSDHDDDPLILSGTWTEAIERGRNQVAKRYLALLLQHYRGNVVEAAKHAGVERESFYRLLRKYDVDPTSFRDGSV